MLLILLVMRIYHVFNRGAHKAKIFLESSNRTRFLDLVDFCRKFNYSYSVMQNRLKKTIIGKTKDNITAEILSRYEYEEPLVTILCYVLMPNHFHLCVKENESGNLSTFMQKLANAYTKYFNLKHKKSGVLFQGRYKKVEVTSESQLTHLSRYIHINPLAFLSADKLSNYVWSSLPEYISLGDEHISDTSMVLSSFKDGSDYAEFITAGMSLGDTDLNHELTLDDDFGWFKDEIPYYSSD